MRAELVDKLNTLDQLERLEFYQFRREMTDRYKKQGRQLTHKQYVEMLDHMDELMSTWIDCHGVPRSWELVSFDLTW